MIVGSAVRSKMYTRKFNIALHNILSNVFFFFFNCNCGINIRNIRRNLGMYKKYYGSKKKISAFF